MATPDKQPVTTGLPPFSTGIASIDAALKVLIPGDNVVWQVDDVDLPGGLRLNLHADTVKQRAICYLGK